MGGVEEAPQTAKVQLTIATETPREIHSSAKHSVSGWMRSVSRSSERQMADLDQDVQDVEAAEEGVGEHLSSEPTSVPMATEGEGNKEATPAPFSELDVESPTAATAAFPIQVVEDDLRVQNVEAVEDGIDEESSGEPKGVPMSTEGEVEEDAHIAPPSHKIPSETP